MFGLFKKKQKQFHEPIEKQLADVTSTMTDEISTLGGKKTLDGLDCDALPSGTGPFGSLNNPIPVNGGIGEIKYLSKLRSPTGHPLFFHRVCSKRSDATPDPVDCFEVISRDGTWLDILHFDRYHPRRSNLMPVGYTLMPYRESLGKDPLGGFGCTHHVADFPKGLPAAVANFYGESMGAPLAEMIETSLQQFDFSRPLKNPLTKF